MSLSLLLVNVWFVIIISRDKNQDEADLMMAIMKKMKLQTLAVLQRLWVFAPVFKSKMADSLALARHLPPSRIGVRQGSCKQALRGSVSKIRTNAATNRPRHHRIPHVCTWQRRGRNICQVQAISGHIDPTLSLPVYISPSVSKHVCEPLIDVHFANDTSIKDAPKQSNKYPYLQIPFKKMKGTGQHLCERPLIVQQPTSEAREQYVELLDHL